MFGTLIKRTSCAWYEVQHNIFYLHILGLRKMKHKVHFNFIHESCIKHRFLPCRDLKSITDREVCCFMISCKNSTNIDTVIDWLVKHSKSKNWVFLFVPDDILPFLRVDFLQSVFEVTLAVCPLGFVDIWPWSSVLCLVQTTLCVALG